MCFLNQTFNKSNNKLTKHCMRLESIGTLHNHCNCLIVSKFPDNIKMTDFNMAQDELSFTQP